VLKTAYEQVGDPLVCRHPQRVPPHTTRHLFHAVVQSLELERVAGLEHGDGLVGVEAEVSAQCGSDLGSAKSWHRVVLTMSG
jgi:hypothetical protein